MMKLLLISIGCLAVLSSVVAKKCKRDEKCAIPFNRKMRKAILAYHNDKRSKANPTAGNMQKIYWDKTMAKMALAHSLKCKFDHDTSAERRFGGYINVGQNLWSGTRRPNGSSPAIGWWSEVKWFNFGEKTKHVVGHYTQLMQAKAARVGCGTAYCPSRKLKYIVTCNYLKGQYDYTNPYTLGKPCEACPKTCKNNMCDCRGLVCKNGGKLDLNTCRCKCLGHSYGRMCQKMNCKKKEWRFCGYYKKYCSVKYGFKPRTKCPQTCNLCKKK